MNPLAKVELKDIYNEYQSYCYENDDYKLKKRAFSRELESKGYKKEVGAANKTFIYGIELNEITLRRSAELRAKYANRKNS